MNDTPQTDALEKTAMFATRPKDPICGEALLHARKMEREKNKLRALMQELVSLQDNCGCVWRTWPIMDRIKASLENVSRQESTAGEGQS